MQHPYENLCPRCETRNRNALFLKQCQPQKLLHEMGGAKIFIYLIERAEA